MVPSSIEAQTTSPESTSSSRPCDLEQQLHFRRLPLPLLAQLADQRLQALGGERLRTQRFPCPLDGFCQPLLIERLQDVVHGVHFERLHRVLIVGRGKNDVRHLALAILQPLDDAEAVQPRHLHVQKHQVRIVLLDQGHGFQAVLALPHDGHLGEALQQIR